MWRSPGSSLDFGSSTDNGEGNEVVVMEAHDPSLESSLELLGQQAQKSGKASGRTFGVVEGVGMYVMRYEELANPLVFMNGLRIVPRPEYPGDEISKAGDSGAVWFYLDKSDPENSKAIGIGLHVDGEKNPEKREERAIACLLKPALDKVGVSLPSPSTRGNHPENNRPQVGTGSVARTESNESRVKPARVNPAADPEIASAEVQPQPDEPRGVEIHETICPKCNSSIKVECTDR